MEYTRYLVILTIAVYFVFQYFDSKQIKDEREEFIRLKTFELIQMLTMWMLVAISLGLIFFPDVSAFYPVLCLVGTCLYGEIFGKLYYRKKF